jgi:hypothetical protein
LGEVLTSLCAGKRRGRFKYVKEEVNERTALLGGDEYLESDREFDVDGEPIPRKPFATAHQRLIANKPIKSPTWSQVLTPQSKLVLASYFALALHSMAFDALLPVFLYHPTQDLDDPDVHLPFKFSGGYGIGKFVRYSRHV